MKVDTFRIDGMEQGWRGVHDPRKRWNGWACPWFTRETLEEIAEWLRLANIDRDPHAHRLEFRDGSVVETDGITEWVLPTMTMDGVEFFRCGDGWVWDADGDFPADDEEAE